MPEKMVNFTNNRTFQFTIILMVLTGVVENTFAEELEVAIIETQTGKIVIELLPDYAPNTVDNFRKLASSGFYDGTIFHRIVPNFVIQGGDPNTKTNLTETWGKGEADHTIELEYNNLMHKKYAVSMARGTDPNSASSQFFIVLQDAPWLDGNYAIFGIVIEGKDIVDRIGSAPTNNKDQPIDVESVRIIKVDLDASNRYAGNDISQYRMPDLVYPSDQAITKLNWDATGFHTSRSPVFNFQRTVIIEYSGGGEIADAMRGQKFTTSYSIDSTNSDMQDLIKEINLALLEAKSSVTATDVKIEYYVTVVGENDFALINYKIVLIPTLDGILIREYSEGTPALFDTNWLGIKLESPIILTAEDHGSLNINQPISFLQQFFPSVEKHIRGTQVEKMLVEPLIDATELNELPVVNWNFSFDSMEITTDTKKFGFSNSKAPISFFTIEKASKSTKQDQFTGNENYSVTVIYPQTHASMYFAGYATPEYIDDLKVIGTLEKDSRITTICDKTETLHDKFCILENEADSINVEQQIQRIKLTAFSKYQNLFLFDMESIESEVRQYLGSRYNENRQFFSEIMPIYERYYFTQPTNIQEFFQRLDQLPLTETERRKIIEVQSDMLEVFKHIVKKRIAALDEIENEITNEINSLNISEERKAHEISLLKTEIQQQKTMMATAGAQIIQPMEESLRNKIQLENTRNDLLRTDDSKSFLGGGGCLIATATYGTELSPQVQLLREMRDNHVFNTKSGAAFMAGFNEFYYLFSPTISDWERQNVLFKEIIKLAITPMLSTLSILSYADIDSERELLIYGTGVILLNIGMYFVVPTIIIIRLRNRLTNKEEFV